jgi:hypothetical protein
LTRDDSSVFSNSRLNQTPGVVTARVGDAWVLAEGQGGDEDEKENWNQIHFVTELGN